MIVKRLAAAVAAVGLAACAGEPQAPSSELPSFASAASSVSPILDSINGDLAARGLDVRVSHAEFVLAASGRHDAAGQILFANNRAKRLDTRWVPGDARRLADGNRLTYLNFTPFMAANAGGGASVAGTAAVNASFDTWDAQVCSVLDLVERPWDGATNPSALLNVGLPQDIFAADITTMGFLPGALFDAVLGPGASSNVLGVTFTFIFINVGTGEPTDVDGDGRDDTALKEVWYNNAFAWGTSGAPGPIDIETVALHENGHALELGHFGKIFGTLSNLKLHVSPRAVMNAAILGTLRQPLGSDNAAYCGNFDSWPG